MSLFFAQPFFLFGLLAVGLPVLIHLIHRQKRRRYRFSTLRFLIASDKRSARRHRLLDILALLLRMAVLLLLALALAQPLLRPRTAAGAKFGPMSVAIVLDDSLSMQRSAGGASLFDKAIESTKQLLRAMPQDAEVCVLLSSGRTPNELSTPTCPPANLQPLLDRVECSYGGRPLAPAINNAVELLSTGKRPNRMLVLVSDLGVSAFATMSASLNHDRLSKVIDGLYLLPVDGGAGGNLALVKAEGIPPMAFPGSPLSVHAEVAGSSKDAEKGLVSLWVGEQKIAEKEVEVAAGKPADVAFEHTIQDPGQAAASVRLQPDALPADNIQHLVFDILPQVKVALIAPSGMDPDIGDESLYLRTALNPLLSPTTAGSSPVDVTPLSYETVQVNTLAAYRAIFLIYDPSLPPALLGALDQFTSNGGTVVVFPSASLTKDLAAQARLVSGGYLGLKVAKMHDASADSGPLGIGELTRDDPAIAFLQRMAPQLFGMVSLQHYFALDENQFDRNTRVLMRASDGGPLLLERHSGRGNWLAFTTGCHPAWGDLPLQPLFLPMLYEFLKSSISDAQPPVGGAGVDEGFSIPVPREAAGGLAVIANPAGVETQIALNQGQTRLEFSDTARPGIYKVTWMRKPDQTQLVAVNASSTESGDERIEPAKALALLKGNYAEQSAKDAQAVATQLHYATQGVELSATFLWLALGALLSESFVANALLREPKKKG